MASVFPRRQKWWLKFCHPVTNEIIRESLETSDYVGFFLILEPDLAGSHAQILPMEIEASRHGYGP